MTLPWGAGMWIDEVSQHQLDQVTGWGQRGRRTADGHTLPAKLETTRLATPLMPPARPVNEIVRHHALLNPADSHWGTTQSGRSNTAT